MLVLASKSPRRRQLISLLGCEFAVNPAEVNEEIFQHELPGEYVKRVALEKALFTYRKMSKYSGMESLVIGADTSVVVWSRNSKPGIISDDKREVASINRIRFEILGKPSDLAEARRVLFRLRGRVHQVISAIAVIRGRDGQQFVDTCITDVPMRRYTDEEVTAYVASGDPLDKAGSYAIQHSEFHPVQNLQGCYANVMGLPLCHLMRTLRKAGHSPSTDVPSACQAFLEYDCPVYNEIIESE